MQNVPLVFGGYHAVNDRVAANLTRLASDIGISVSRIREVLEELGFRILVFDPIALAKEHVGKASYRRGARIKEAPAVFDCSSFTAWMYGQLGIELPRYTVGQLRCGVDPGDELKPLDLVFTTGWRSYRLPDVPGGVGHVGVYTGAGTIIHAANSARGLVEDSFDHSWSGAEKYRGVRRYIPNNDEVATLECPVDRPISWEVDLIPVILQRLP